MPTSVNKGYELQTTGTNPDLWGDILNEDVFEIIDRNLGGSVTKSLTNVNVLLTAEESQNMRLILNGTLTGNVLVETVGVGFFVVENNCTGNFTVTFRKQGVGTAITVPNGTVNLAVVGASGNPKLASQEFPTGTRMLFQQTTPPVGWTKDTTTSNLNNSALRIVTGTAGSGGGIDFTSAFASRALSGSVNGHTLTEAQLPSHRHFAVANENVDSATLTASNQVSIFGTWGGSSSIRYNLVGANSDATVGRTSATGSNQSHNHGLSLTNLDISARYFDVTVGVRQ